MKDDLVSIIIPVYNSSKYLKDTIKTIKNQTYTNWEAIFVDDCSTDNSVEIIKNAIKSDKRIRLFQNSINSGAATSRNKGITESLGNFLCFLDADDLWENKKLEKQIEYMKQLNCEFCFTDYEFTNSDGIPNGKKVIVPKTITYKQALKNTTIWTSTVMFDMKKIFKEDIMMPNIKRGQDTATWWKILKKVDCAYGLNRCFSYYRRTNESLSANKFKALKRTWNLYRNVEHLSFFSSCYNFCWYCFNAIRRRM